MMDVGVFVIQIGATVLTVLLGFWKVHEKLRDRIEDVKKEIAQDRLATTSLMGAVGIVGQKVDNFTNLCAAHRGALAQRIEKLEASPGCEPKESS